MPYIFALGSAYFCLCIDFVESRVLSTCCVCRYASLYFCCCVEADDNELLTLEVIHRYVELLDKYFGSVSTHYSTAHHSPNLGFAKLH